MKLGHPFKIITRPLNNLHTTICIDCPPYIAHKALRCWGEGNIHKGTLVFNYLPWHV